ncbi:MAG: insulinase family protein [Dehalococcoidia bacterium]|nr:insulinase family protein [Dehalococcoidia bacterium]MDW8120225.1 pitrilysin family protein [Chloroflexota bacterium]
MFQKHVLGNGLRIITCPMPHTRSVTVAFFIGAGSRYEPDELGGAFHFAEHMLFKGTQRRPTARHISEAIEGVGGIMNGSTDRETTIYWAKVARPHFSHALDLLADMLLHSRFAPEEIEKERRVILEELAATKDHPNELVHLLLDAAMWPNHPMGRDVGGTPESVASLTRQALLDTVAHHYVATNAVCVVAGAVEGPEVVEAVTSLVENWPQGTPSSFLPIQDTPRGPQVRLERRPTEQAHLALGIPAYPVGHPDRYALDLLSVVLGEGTSSRLFLELRERRGLVYDVSSTVAHYQDCGTWTISLGVEPSHGADATQVVVDELVRLREGVSLEELHKAKELVKGRILLRMEDTRAVAFWAGAQETLLGRILTPEEVVQKVEAVTPEDLQRVAQHLVHPQHLTLAIVGPYRSERRFLRILQG